MLGEACRQAAAWQRQRPDGSPLTVSVNLSARQAAAADLTELVTKALADSGLDPHMLCLELTETALFEAGSSTLQKFCQLKELGVWLAIDDFGTGYASMTYLKEFPVDYLKVDRSFVQGVTASASDAAIVEALIRLGGSQGAAATPLGRPPRSARPTTDRAIGWPRCTDTALDPPGSAELAKGGSIAFNDPRIFPPRPGLRPSSPPPVRRRP